MTTVHEGVVRINRTQTTARSNEDRSQPHAQHILDLRTKLRANVERLPIGQPCDGLLTETECPGYTSE